MLSLALALSAGWGQAQTRATAFYQRGLDFYFQKQPGLALEQFERCLARAPEMASANFYAALSHQELNDHRAALEHFEQAEELGFGGAKVFFYHHASLMALGDTAAAAQVLRAGAERNPQDVNTESLLVELANHHLRVQQPRAALAYLDQCALLAPREPRYAKSKGMLLLELGDTATATREFARCLELCPSDFEASFLLGTLPYNLGVRLSKQAEQLGAASAQATLLRLEAERLFQEALPHFEHAVSLRPDDPLSREVLFNLYIKLRQYENAARFAPNGAGP